MYSTINELNKYKQNRHVAILKNHFDDYFLVKILLNVY